MSIWDLFNKKPGHKKTRKRKTNAEKRKEWAEERLMTRAQTDPRAESAMILEATGINIPPPDESKQEEKKLDEKITKMAFEEIESDESLKKRATAMKIERILGSDPREVYREEGGQYYPSEGERGPLDTIREYRALEAEFGSGTGTLSFLKDPEVISQLLVLLRSLLPTNAGVAAMGVGNDEQRTIVVEVDGRSIVMSPEAYKVYTVQKEQLLSAQSKLKQLTDGGIPDVETEGQSDSKAEMAGTPTMEDGDEEAGIAPFVADKQSDTVQATAEEVKSEEIDIEEFLPFAELIANAMEGTPEQFAKDLKASAEEGNQDARMLLLFLSTVTYDNLLELVKPYEQTEGLLPYINILSENKEWVEEVLTSIRRLVT